ncbi:MAG: hypothetical protein M0R80_22435 [Proteobacteria bacterium]|jgi:hypothetical protein|nr:hypothetical protein [Pseudomonadota bacterium]
MIAPFKPRDPRIVLLLLLGLGLVLLVVNADLPFVKHSMVYIRTAYKVLSGSMSLGDLVADPNARAYEKPLGMVLSLLPFVAALGYHVGPMVHSYVTATLFALAAFAALGRLSRRLEIPRERLGAMLVVTFLNPVAVYQFWAVGPDALFAAAFMASFALLDRVIELLESRPSGSARTLGRTWLWFGLYLLSAYATVAIKFYGVTAIPIHALYAAALIRSARLPMRALAPLAAPTALLLLGIAVYPGSQILGTKDFAHYLQMITGLKDAGPSGVLIEKEGRLLILGSNAVMVVVSLLLSLNVLVVCLFRRYRRRELPILAAVALFTLGLMLHRGSFYNLRFLLPISPFVAALVVGSPRFPSRRLVGTFLAVGMVLVLLFNVQSPAAFLLELRGQSKVTLAGRAFRTLNNLRIGSRMQTRMVLEVIEETVPAGEPLVFVSNYFGDAYHGTFELTGFFEPPGEVHYFRRCREVVPPAKVFYMAYLEKGCRMPFEYRKEKLRPWLLRVSVLGEEKEWAR